MRIVSVNPYQRQEWRVTFHYDSAFVDECLSHPGKTRFMVSFLNNSVRRSREARQVKEVES